MLKVSSKDVTFCHNQTIKSLTLENSFSNNIIFKIRVNAVGLLSIEPNKGFIRANSQVPFILKSLSKDNFEVKVLFTYGFIINKNHEFKEEWKKIEQNGKFQHCIIMVRRIQPYRTNEKDDQPENLNSSRKNKYSINSSPIRSPSNKISSIQKKRGQSPSPSKSNKQMMKTSKVIKKGSLNYEEFAREIYLQDEPQDECPLYSIEQMQQFIQKLRQLQKDLENQQIQNKKLKQQLSISEAKLKQITEDKMHIQTHKSIGIVCEDYHTTFTHLIILGLACFVLGFFLAKVQAEIF